MYNGLDRIRTIANESKNTSFSGVNNAPGNPNTIYNQKITPTPMSTPATPASQLTSAQVALDSYKPQTIGFNTPTEAQNMQAAADGMNTAISSVLSQDNPYIASARQAGLEAASNDGYVDDYNTTQEQHLSLPRASALYKDDFTNTTDIKDLADRGLSLKLKISGRETVLTEPPHVCQLITTLHKPGGKLDV